MDKEVLVNELGLDEEGMRIRESHIRHSNITNEFCDANETINCVYVNPRNHLPVDHFGFAYMDISTSRDYLQIVQTEVIEPLNEFYREKVSATPYVCGEEDSFFDIGAFIVECFETGLRYYEEGESWDDIDDLNPLERYREKMENNILMWVESYKDTGKEKLEEKKKLQLVR